MNKEFLFTVFTPTYNRAHTLPRVYESLLKQPKELFEWLVVDDGSTDDTQALLDRLQQTAPFPMRVITQENGGKHRAHNVAIKTARGELTVILDSDDELTPDALVILSEEWKAIPAHDRKSFAGLLGHCLTPSGEIHGARYPEPFFDGHHFYLAAQKIMRGEKLPCYRTDVLKEFPFPERSGCNAYVSESTVWYKIGEKYKVRCIDKDVRVYHQDMTDANALMVKYKGNFKNSWGSLQYHIVVLNLFSNYWPKFFVQFCKSAAGCTRYALHSKSGLLSPFDQLNSLSARILWIVGIPVGCTAWLIDCLRIKYHSNRV